MFDAKQYLKHRKAAAKRRFVKHVPYSWKISENEIGMKYGGVMTVAEIRGPDPASCTDDFLVNYHADLNRMLRSLGDGYTLNFEMQCDPMEEYPGEDIPEEERWRRWPDHASYLLDEESRSQFNSKGNHVDVRSFLSVTYRMPQEGSAFLKSLLVSRPKYEKKRRVNYASHLEDYRRKVHAFLNPLGKLMHVRRLGYRETLEYLHSTVSTNRQPLGEPSVFGLIDRQISDQTLDGDFDLTLGGTPIRVMEISQWSTESWPTMFAALNRLGRRYRFCIRFQCRDPRSSEKVVRDAAASWAQVRKNFFELFIRTVRNIPADAPGGDNKRAAGLADEAEATINDVQKGHYTFGKMTVALVLYGKDKEDLDKQESDVNTILFKSKTIFKKSDWNAFDAYLGTLPGHLFANGCWSDVSTMNLAHMMPATAVWTGSAWNDYLKGPALLYTTTEGNIPFRVNVHIRDIGHVKIFGRSGAGKTTLLDRMRAAWRRYRSETTGRHGRTITFEVGRGAVCATRAMGGVTLDLGRKGEIGLQPYARIDQEIWRVRMHQWTLDLLKAQGVTLDQYVEDDVTRAMALLAKNAPRDRTMTHMQTYLRTEALQIALAPFTDDVGQPYGYLFDNDHENIELADVVTFEMAQLFENEKICIPTLTYLFWVIEDSLDGTDTLLVVDEGWQFLEDSFFASKLKKWLRGMRKKRCAVWFATQSLDDLSSTAAEMLKQEHFPTGILLANESAATTGNRKIYEAIGCNAKQIEIVASLEPAKEAYLMNPLGARRFSMNLGPVGRALCGRSEPADLLLSDRLWALYRNDHSRYLKEWVHARLPKEWADEAVGPLDDIMMAAE